MAIYSFSDTSGFKRVDALNAFVKNGKIYVSLSYTYETVDEVRRVGVPMVELPIQLGTPVKLETYESGRLKDSKARVIVQTSNGNLSLHAEEDEEGCLWYNHFLKERVKEMTLEEIEKKLGHKVKVVAKK